MTRKQIKKLANQIYEQELIHQNPTSTKEEKAKAEDTILKLSNMLACLPDGLSIMDEVDEIIQKKLADENNKEKKE